MRTVRTLLTMAAYALCVPCALAQTLNFTNDFSHAKGEHADPELLKAQPDTAHFPAGSAVWAVLNPAAAGYADINAFSGKPQGGGSLRRTIEMDNGYGRWDLVDTQLLPVPPNLGTGKSIVMVIIPDKVPDKPTALQPFNQLLDMIAKHKGPSPILMRVKIEGGDARNQYSQNGFYLDIADGLGRYGEWLAQRSAAEKAASEAFEQQHLQPRSAFVRDYRSLKTDPKFVADVRKWWSDKVGGPLLSAKVCSADTMLVRNNLGDVTEKQLCALVTYKDGTRCFAMMRYFAYRRLGADTFENDLIDRTTGYLSIPADEGENFFGAQKYPIECNATK